MRPAFRRSPVPEGDALYRFAAKVGAALDGKTIAAARAHGPGPVPQVHRIVGVTCTGVRSQGKNLIISFENGLALRGHLRMYGSWHVYKPGEAWTKPEHQARLVLEVDDAVVVNFSAPVIEMLEERHLIHHKPIGDLGPNLLDDDFDIAEVLRRIRDPLRADLTIGDAVMDQRVAAGVGNIWKHESLFRTGINPWRRVNELTDQELHGLFTMAEALLRASVGKPNSLEMNRAPSMYVYMRPNQPCRRCYTKLLTARQGVDIRYTTWCPKCQPIADGQTPPPVDNRGRILRGPR